jgi:hypothetical protein
MTTALTNPEDKCLQFNIYIRVFGEGDNYTHSHGYLVDDMPTGISPPIGCLNIDARTHTLAQLRPLIEYKRQGHMDRRSLMFQEALFIMNRLPNIYNRSKEDLIKYSFGFVLKEGTDVKLIHPDRETEFISNLIGAVDFFSHDLILIPWSQIPTTYQTAPTPVAPAEEEEDEEEEEEEGKEKEEGAEEADIDAGEIDAEQFEQDDCIVGSSSEKVKLKEVEEID